MSSHDKERFLFLPHLIRLQSYWVTAHLYNLINIFNINYLLNTLSPDTVTLKVRGSTYEFGGAKFSLKQLPSQISEYQISNKTNWS